MSNQPKAPLSQEAHPEPSKVSSGSFGTLANNAEHGLDEFRLAVISLQTADHQATMGCFVGKLAVENGKGTMVDFKYVDGASVLPGPSEVAKLRPT
jgi:hypothetical protein